MGVIEGVETAALNAATGGFGGSALALLKRYWKPALVVIAVLVIVGALVSHIASDRRTRNERDGLAAWQTVIVTELQRGMPKGTKVKSDDALAALQWLILDRAGLQKQLDDQNAALVIANSEAQSAQNAVTTALSRAKERDQAREATRAALTDPKRHSGLTAAEWGKL